MQVRGKNLWRKTGWGVRGALRGLCIELILIWRWCVAPMLGPRCRFTPSCSHYAEEALRVHGVLGGGVLTLRRLLRCTALSAGGDDPVPGTRQNALAACCADKVIDKSHKSHGRQDAREDALEDTLEDARENTLEDARENRCAATPYG